ncbi:hypothetical protein AKJ47_02380 [candidate division MSBL1 archaeon SCGC-AAA261G05]|uniref:OB domain-containing protein n=1 Tax=candidate division MSBL1 archaeon SCGC-AAA261G05 TaxID=1698276 RepID=A0A133VAB5_9EURY|nr:hypothetical protein AKJ47_02380 [candidate division MSBL1 archaeon SCGC-AAA261G05]
MEGFTPYHKPSAKPRRIAEIKTGDDQIQVVGTVVDKKESELIIDDGSGRLPVLFEEPGLPKEIEVGSKVRVFGTPLNVEEAHELHAEIIQKLDGLDLGLYREARHEIKKFEKELEQYEDS